MPDGSESTPAPSAPAADTASPAAPVSAAPAAEPQAPSSESVYDTAFQEHLAPKPDPEAKAAPETPAAAPKAETPAAPAGEPALTDGEKAVLSRAKIEPKALQGLSREQIDLFVGSIRTQQAEQDSLRSQMGRKPDAKDDKPAPEAKAPAAPTDWDAEVDQVIGKVAEAYDDEIKPVGDLVKKVGGRLGSLEQSVQAIPTMMNVLEELAIDLVVGGLEGDFPSVKTPESRAKVVERLKTEFATGAYGQNHGSLVSALRAAAKAAAQVTLGPATTEAAAAANLVNTNKNRLASQPKVGSGATRQPPKTADDVYDQAFQEHLASA